jgi:L-malate glycosyltransferase
VKKHGLRILHILPHLGGGVGAVMRAWLRSEAETASANRHAVVALETVNEPSRTCFNAVGVPWEEQASAKRMNTLVENADVVVIHWWNHPLLTKLLYDGLGPARVVFWSHVNGLACPQSFCPEIFEVPDWFVFASTASWLSPVVQALPGHLQARIRVIRSCAGIPREADSPHVKPDEFQIGYVGTVEPAKMNAVFLTLCDVAEIRTPCLVAGGPLHHELMNQAKSIGKANRFDIRGPVADPTPLWRQIHVLAYPLCPTHYGTGEQSLIEAMAFGVVPVTLANPPEKALLRHRETGWIADTPSDFTEALRFLLKHPDERKRMAEAGRRFVQEECRMRTTQQAFTDLFTALAEQPKRSRRLTFSDMDDVSPGSPFHLFLAACGDPGTRSAAWDLAKNKRCEEIPGFFSYATRGSPSHYLRMLGSDSHLERICLYASTHDRKR